MLDRLGIRSRVLLLALLPASLMALVLGSYFTWLQQNDLRTQLLQRGKMIAEQLAPLAAPAMARLAPAQLERIAAQTLEQADVRAVAFLPRTARAWPTPARACSTCHPAAGPARNCCSAVAMTPPAT